MEPIALAGVRRLGALGDRDFRRLFLASAVSLVGDQIVPVALSFAVLDLTGSVSDVGFVLAAGTVPLVAFLLVGGVVADRMSRRRLMIAADLVSLAAQTTLATLLLTGAAELWHLVVLRAIAGGAFAFFTPAATGLMPQVVRSENLQQANALRGMTYSLGGVVGPAIAGVLVGTTSPGVALAVDAATFAASALLLSGIHAPALERPAEPATFLGDLLHGWREFRSRTWLWAIVVQFGATHLTTAAPFFVLGAVVAKRELGGAGAWSLILAALGLGALLGSLVSIRLRPRRPLLVATIGTFGLPLPVVLLAAGAPALAVAAGAFVAGVGFGLFGTMWETTLQREVPPEALSRVSAYDWFGSIATLPLGFALVGPVTGVLGISTTLWLAGATALVASAVVLAVPDVRRVRVAPELAS